ncbi:MAG: hypothetical protein IJ740_08000 [Ruminococcus sp.]|nr:hypothetical protein [Ruminococcus sp.]
MNDENTVDLKLNKRLLELRKIAVILRLMGNAFIAIICAGNYVEDRQVIRHVATGATADVVLAIICIDSLIAIGWLAGETAMKFHFGVHILLFVVLVLAVISEADFVVVLIAGFVWLIIAFPFILYFAVASRIRYRYYIENSE